MLGGGGWQDREERGPAPRPRILGACGENPRLDSECDPDTSEHCPSRAELPGPPGPRVCCARSVAWPPLLLGARRLVSSGGGGARFMESGFIVNP